jgi:pseudouridine-5'-phosphate glycosidase
VPIRYTPEVAAARRDGRPIVALESSVLAQGLPRPRNAEAARRMLDAVRAGGAVPGITAVVGGAPTVGLTSDELDRFLSGDAVHKAAARDLPAAVAFGHDAATTVAGALAICRSAGVGVFATGGIGGVHREPPFDESADLLELSRSPVVVVCAGAKSVLDLAATLERLESFSVAVVGFGTAEFPGFFFASTGLALRFSVNTADDVARLYRAHRRLDSPGAVLVVQPPPASAVLPRELVERAAESALDEARAAGVRGSAVTPFLLDAIERATGGRSVETNLALLEANARLAGEIASAVAAPTGAQPAA